VFPSGQTEGAPEDKFRLAPVAKRLAELIKKPVATTRDCVGPEAEAAVKAMKDGDILLLEICVFTRRREERAGIFQGPCQSGGSLCQ